MLLISVVDKEVLDSVVGLSVNRTKTICTVFNIVIRSQLHENTYCMKHSLVEHSLIRPDQKYFLWDNAKQ
jgi:hypothetical protein